MNASAIFLLLVTSTIPMAAQSVDRHLAAGDRAYHDLRTMDAVADYSRAAALAPGDYRVLLRLARSWADIGRLNLRRSDSSETYYRRSVSFAEKMVELYPDSAASWFMLALCHGSLAPFKSLTEKLNIARDVEKNALRALAIDPSYGMVHVLLGIYYREASRLSWIERTIANGILGKEIIGSLEASEEQLRIAIRLDETNSYAWFELGTTLRRQERMDEATEAFERCAALPVTNEREAQQNERARSIIERARTASAE